MKKISNHQEIMTSSNFDRALRLSMGTAFLGIFFSIHIQFAKSGFTPSILDTLLLSVLVTMGTIIFAVWAGVIRLMVELFRWKSDPFWVVLVMPPLAFVVSFAATTIFLWL